MSTGKLNEAYCPPDDSELPSAPDRCATVGSLQEKWKREVEREASIQECRDMLALMPYYFPSDIRMELLSLLDKFQYEMLKEKVERK